MRNRRHIRSLIIILLLLMASSFYYLPYYVSKPGMAKELSPIIEVEDGYRENGTFMLTTVRMGRANIYSYVLAKMSKYQEIFPIEAIRDLNESDQEYNVRQLHMMDSSKTFATEVAFQKAGIPVDYEYRGVYVLRIVPEMPADGKLQTGDLVFKVDGKEFESSKEFIQYVKGKNEGDKVELTYKRKGKTNKAVLPLKRFPENPGQIGVGIELVDDKDIVTDPKVSVETDEIGGPSAGLMFSLEIYNQLTKEDLTRGYKIAGTGTISPDGTVGRIGGIEQKIIAADQAGVEIFLAPNEEGATDSNYRAAVKTGKDIKTKMKIVPVDTFDKAVEYLEGLKEKKG